MPPRFPAECELVQSRLFDLFDNALSSAERERIETHLETCARCTKEWESVRVAERSLLTTLYKLPSAGDLRPDFYARLQQEGQKSPKRNGFRPVMWWGFAGAAMTCALALFLFRPTVPSASIRASAGEVAKIEPKQSLKTEKVAALPQPKFVETITPHIETQKPSVTKLSGSPLEKVKTATKIRVEVADSGKMQGHQRGQKKSDVAEVRGEVIVSDGSTTDGLSSLMARAKTPGTAFSYLFARDNKENPAPENKASEALTSSVALLFKSDASAKLQEPDESVRGRDLEMALVETPTEEASFTIQDTERDFEAEAHIVGNTEERDGTTLVTIDAGE